MNSTRRVYQAGKLKIFCTLPKWVVSYIAYTKFHSPRPAFHSPGQIFTHSGERASASFPACLLTQKSMAIIGQMMIHQQMTT